MSEEKLKPCPFCGGKSEFWRYHWARDNTLFWYVKCLECGIGSWYYDTQEKAAKAWNKRSNFLTRLWRRIPKLHIEVKYERS